MNTTITVTIQVTRGEGSQTFTADATQGDMDVQTGKLREASWDEALTLVAEKLKVAKAEGPQAVAGLSSARCTNEDNYVFQKFIRTVGETNNVDHCAHL